MTVRIPRGEPAQTRRQFIRGVAKKSIYAAPLILTFAKADLVAAQPNSNANERAFETPAGSN